MKDRLLRKKTQSGVNTPEMDEDEYDDEDAATVEGNDKIKFINPVFNTLDSSKRRDSIKVEDSLL